MFVFLSSKVRRWLLMALLVPVGIWVADWVADRLEERKGRSKLTQTLRMPGRWRRGEPLLAH